MSEGRPMRSHLQRDLERLTKNVLAVGSIVEEATQKAIAALVDRRLDVAQEVQEGDAVVDQREVEVEEECLKILALHAPVAADLRLVIAFLKLNNDLERIGDLAKNIAERAAWLATRDEIQVPEAIPKMARMARKMLRDCLDAVVNGDTALARQVVADDEEIDSAHGRFYGWVADRIREEPPHAGEYLQLLSVSRYLERIADQATNVAEDVVFMVDGEVIRHQG